MIRKSLRKGQAVGQIFVFIMAIIITAFIILFGVKFIKDMMGKQDQVLLVEFENNVRTSIGSTSFGSVKITSLKLPSEYDKVCFVDYQMTPREDPELTRFFTELRAREGSVSPETNIDMFLIDTKGNSDPGDDTIHSTSVGKVKMLQSDNFFKCFSPGSGSFKLRFEGISGGVTVSQYEGTE